MNQTKHLCFIKKTLHGLFENVLVYRWQPVLVNVNIHNINIIIHLHRYK